jgi:crossover junction endodeoxyribonuclease RusA
MTITITMPLPPRELWQNSRCHWARRSKIGAKAKDAAYVKSLAKIGRKPPPKWKAGTLDTVWYWPDKRRRDPMNALAALKHAIDGMVLAGVLEDDDRLMPGAMRFEYDKTNPRVEITVRGAA